MPLSPRMIQVESAVTVDGARLSWTVEGAGEPLLLIAGQATGRAGWDPVIPELSKTFRVIRFDHRGIAHSTEGNLNRYSTRAFAEDTVAVLDAAGVQKAHIYGHSMGGRVAQWLAIDHADRVATLVLAATSAGGALGTSRDNAATQALTSGDPVRLQPLFFDEEWAGKHQEAVHSYFNAPACARVKSRHFIASRNHDTLSSLSTIHAPTLIIHGTEDLLTPLENALVLYKTIPRATLIKIAGGRHGIHLDHPETMRWIRDFILRKGAHLEEGTGYLPTA